MLSKNNILKLFFNTLLGLVLILVWSRFVNIGQILNQLKNANFSLAALFFVFFVISTTIRAQRLKFFLSSLDLPLKELIPLNFLAQFLSFIIPIRAGEVARAIYLSKLSGQGVGKAVIWVFLDRFLDFWVLIVLAVILGISIPNNLPPQSFRLLTLLMIGFSLAALIFITASDFAKKVARALRLRFMVPLIEQFHLLKRPPMQFLGLLGLSFLAVSSDTFIWYFVLLSLGVNLGILKTYLGASLSILTFVIPSAPGYVGSAEAAGLAVFSGVLGVGSNLASSAVVLNHLLTIIALPIAGIISLYFLKFDLSQVWKVLKKDSNRTMKQ